MSQNKLDLDPKILGEDVEKKRLLEIYSIETLLNSFGSSKISGLPTKPDFIDSQKRRFGENFIPPKIPHTYLYYVWKAGQDHMLIFLFIGGIITFVSELVRDKHSFGVDGIAIILAVLIVISVTSLNDYFKEKKFRDLARSIKLNTTCSVLRDGNIIEICTKDLVVGDIYLPKYGDQIPADAVVIKSENLRVDESAVTGESDLILKDPLKSPYLLASTFVMDGAGTALVVAVGLNSQTGRIMNLLGATKSKKKSEDSPRKEKSVLQEKLTRLAMLVGKFGVAAGVSVFLIQVIRYSVTNFSGKNPRKFDSNDFLEYLYLLLQGFTVVVVAVPEGLPLAVTVSLAYSVMRMLEDKNLVRQLYSCETMGNATTICSDKTGTLTTNRMTVIRAYLADSMFSNFSKITDVSDKHKNILILNICVNKSPSSTLKPAENNSSPPIQFGNKTDCAMLGFLENLGTTFKEFSENFCPEMTVKFFPFNSEKKIMTTIIDLNDGENFRVLAKGAPDILLSKCTHKFDSSGEIIEINSPMRKKIKNMINEMSSEALRTIILSYKDIKKININNDTKETEITENMVFIALFGIEDPVRPDVQKAIRLCKKAGITVRMVTGDNINTARSIAKKCGIIGYQQDELILDSLEFNRLVFINGIYDQNEFDKIWPRLKVLARSSPKDKYVLVTGILETKLEKQVVAVTGDGTNDAPALKAADVGFAMGLAGTDIAKDASDIILTDDNFSNIISAILWGRNVYDCISKFLIFQLTVNLVAVFTSILFSLIWYNIFHSLQLLWVNLVMDTLASLVLATEKPTPELLNRKPYPRNKSLFSRFMVMFILLHSLYQIFILMFLTIFGSTWLGIEDNFSLNYFRDRNHLKRVYTQHSTLIFNIFVLMQIFNQINARKVHGERNVFKNIFENKLFVGIFVLEIFLQIIIVQFGEKWFHVAALSVEQWFWSIFFGSSVLLFHQTVVISCSKILPIPKQYRTTHGIASSVVISEEPKEFDPQLLWIRGLKKLQTQLRVIDAFKENLNVNTM